MDTAPQSDRIERSIPIAEQWPYVRFLGLGAWWAWIWLCYSSTNIMQYFPAGRQPELVATMYLLSTLAIAAAMMAAALQWRRATALVDNKALFIGSGIFAGISTIALGYSVLVGAGVFFALSALFTGLGTAAICLKCGRVYGSVTLGDSLTAGAISLLFAALLYFVGVGIPASWSLFFAAALPVIAALLLTMTPADPFLAASAGNDENLKNPQVKRIYRELVAASAIVALTAGVGKGIIAAMGADSTLADDGRTTVFFIGVIAVLVAITVNQGDSVRGAQRVYSALMVLGVGMMLATCVGMSMSFLSVGKEALWLVFTCFMAYLAFRYDLSPVRVFGFGQSAYFLGSTAGWVIGWFVGPYYDQFFVQLAVGMFGAFLVVVTMVYIFPENDLKRIMAWSVDGDVAHTMRRANTAEAMPLHDEAAAHAVDKMTPAPDERHAETAQTPIAPAVQNGLDLSNAQDPRYGISARELEILDLFAQGRSANWIADHLTISQNTVRSHLRSVYTKLDVHTRQELLDFLAK